jgi:lipid-binding SYLF domain-containing protein
MEGYGMKRYAIPFALTVVLCSLAAAPHKPATEELKTVESATEVVRSFSAIALRGIPKVLLHDAAGVAVIPHVVKAGLVIGGRFGRGVVLVRESNGCWSNPVFVTLSGKSIGGQVGIEKTELILVFKTRKSLDRALRGKLTLGADAAIAAGPIGRDTEAASDRFLRTEIFSYSRSHGLFAGISLEGARIEGDTRANEAFYGLRGGRCEDVLAFRGASIAAIAGLKEELLGSSGTPAAPPVIRHPASPRPPAPPTAVYPAPPLPPTVPVPIGR